jgi:exodeoxyribonuclease III
MKIISYNTNGIRAAIKKGLIDWLATSNANIVCIQETKATKDDVNVAEIEKLGYHTYWFSAHKKGYSGVAVFTKIKPLLVEYGNQFEQSNFEGRVIKLEFTNFVLINAYFPSGTSGDERQNYKYQWLSEFQQYTNSLLQFNKNIIITGDYNIAHSDIDIHDPKGNKKSSGFLPQEKEWMTSFLETNFVDSFRHIHPMVAHKYSWWSQRFPSVRLQNKGWRIDYISVSKALAGNIVDANILDEIKHSDHCPIWVDINI